MKRTERIEIWLSKKERELIDKARGLTALATWGRAQMVEAAEQAAKTKVGKR